MLILYLCCLIFGGILLTVSLFTGTSDSDLSEHPSDGLTIEAHSETPLLSGIEHPLDISHTDLPHDTHLQHLSLPNEPTYKDAVKFVSFRNIIYFLTFFGLTGTILTLLEYSTILTLLFSTLMGAISYIFGYKLTKYLKESETGKAIDIGELTGKLGKVIIPVGKDKKGKILVFLEDQILELTALTSEASAIDTFQQGEKVLIVETNNNIAYIDSAEI